MELPLLLQFSIALFTGMVAATLVPPVRRAIPTPLELGLWIGLIVVCMLGIVGVANPRARELTSSAVWGVDQVVNTMAGLAIGGVIGWISNNRFVITSLLALLAAIVFLVLSMMRLIRKAQGWKPRVWLGEWMEMPSSSAFAAHPAAKPDVLAKLNRRLATSTAVVRAYLLSSAEGLATWVRNVVVPQGAQRLAHAGAVSRVESRATVESIRDATSHLQFAARAWYAAAGAPVVNDIGSRANRALRRAAAAGKRTAVSAKDGHVVEIQALLNAQSIGWYGPLTPGAPLSPPPTERDGSKQGSDRLAS